MNLKFITRCVVILGLAATYSLCQAADIACSAKSISRAKQLLAFHAGMDDRIEIDKAVKELPPVRNPEDPKQSFKVLEVWGHIYKANYRMRFIYFNSPAVSCALMGEEILEYARP